MSEYKCKWDEFFFWELANNLLGVNFLIAKEGKKLIICEGKIVKSQNADTLKRFCCKNMLLLKSKVRQTNTDPVGTG